MGRISASLRALRPLACLVSAWAAFAAGPGNLEVSVLDQSNLPIPGVRLELKAGAAVAASVETDAAGKASLPGLTLGSYSLTATRDGYEPFRKTGLDISGATSLEITLVPKLAASRESVEVTGTATPVEAAAASAPETLQTQDANALPTQPATVSDALPLLPGVVRSPGGGLILSSSGEQRSSMIVNSADVTDPATGEFGLTVPIDSVQSLEFYQTPFLAEYGRFTAGVVSVETRRGGEKWKWELNDPLPDFAVRSWHLRGLRDATPRLNLEGPIVHGKLYFSEGFEYTVRKTPVYVLPFPFNQTREHGINSFAQFDWVASDKHLMTLSLHAAPQRLGYVGLNYYNPQQTAPDASTHNYTGTLSDHLTVGGGLLENTVSATRFTARVWGQGPLDLSISPFGNSGNYFAQQNRDSSRLSWTSDFAFSSFRLLGTHSLKVGAYLAQSSDNGEVADHPINILDANGALLERIAFSGGRPFRNWDMEYAFFAQDHWTVSPRLSVDAGVRTETQEVSESWRVAPRLGLSFSPLLRWGTVINAGAGMFFDRVPLSVYSFGDYPNQTVTMYGPDGQISAGPFFYQNGLGAVSLPRAWVYGSLQPGNFSPRSTTGSIRLDQPVSKRVRLRIGYMQSESDGLVILNPSAPRRSTGVGAYLLSGIGESRYRQFESTARVRLPANRELFFSYVRSHARGDLNDFANYLGSFPSPIVRPNQFGELPTDIPNRFLAWGVVPLPRGFRIAPMMEYRTGFPYSVFDRAQNYVGPPNSSRYPSFLSLDSRFSKDIKVSPKYSVRFSIGGFNLTNHFNPEAVRWNTADPDFGYFFGHRGRRFTADFDVLY